MRDTTPTCGNCAHYLPRYSKKGRPRTSVAGFCTFRFDKWPMAFMTYYGTAPIACQARTIYKNTNAEKCPQFTPKTKAK